MDSGWFRRGRHLLRHLRVPDGADRRRRYRQEGLQPLAFPRAAHLPHLAGDAGRHPGDAGRRRRHDGAGRPPRSRLVGAIVAVCRQQRLLLAAIGIFCARCPAQRAAAPLVARRRATVLSDDADPDGCRVLAHTAIARVGRARGHRCLAGTLHLRDTAGAYGELSFFYRRATGSSGSARSSPSAATGFVSVAGAQTSWRRRGLR